MEISYPVVPFREKINGITIRRKGFQVGKFILVGLATEDDVDHFCIFNSVTLTRIIPNRFRDIGDCIKVAELLRDIYNEHWEIPTVWDGFDVLRCSQWSVPGGTQLYLTLMDLANRDIITLTEVSQTWHNNKDRAEDLVRRYVT